MLVVLSSESLLWVATATLRQTWSSPVQRKELHITGPGAKQNPLVDAHSSWPPVWSGSVQALPHPAEEQLAKAGPAEHSGLSEHSKMRRAGRRPVCACLWCKSHRHWGLTPRLFTSEIGCVSGLTVCPSTCLLSKLLGGSYPRVVPWAPSLHRWRGWSV